jgi:hypothetical protein
LAHRERRKVCDLADSLVVEAATGPTSASIIVSHDSFHFSDDNKNMKSISDFGMKMGAGDTAQRRILTFLDRKR